MSSKRGLVLTLDLAPVFPSLAGQASRQTDTMTACVASEEVLHPFSFPLRFSRQYASGTLVEPNRDETSQPFASLPPPSLACLPARSTCPSPPLLLPLLPFATRSAAACLKVGRSVDPVGRPASPTQPNPAQAPLHLVRSSVVKRRSFAIDDDERSSWDPFLGRAGPERPSVEPLRHRLACLVLLVQRAASTRFPTLRGVGWGGVGWREKGGRRTQRGPTTDPTTHPPHRIASPSSAAPRPSVHRSV